MSPSAEKIRASSPSGTYSTWIISDIIRREQEVWEKNEKYKEKGKERGLDEPFQSRISP
jgi:hypothetical protein